jgi:hypothetical protein
MKDDMEVARSLLAKVQHFVSTQLDDDESEMFASLLAPGVSLAYSERDVVGFGATVAEGDSVEWRPGALAESLGTVLREGGIRVVGLRG